jgi:hypothetical protein
MVLMTPLRFCGALLDRGALLIHDISDITRSKRFRLSCFSEEASRHV